VRTYYSDVPVLALLSISSVFVHMLHSQKKQQFGSIFICGSGSRSSFLIYKTVKNLFHFSVKKNTKGSPQVHRNIPKPVESSIRNVYISRTIETKFLKIFDHFSICKVQGPGSTPNGFIVKNYLWIRGSGST
jgi:hypothetical protein